MCVNKRNTACHISKHQMRQPSSHHIPAVPAVSPEGTQHGNLMPTIKPYPAATPWRTPEKTPGEKPQNTGPRELRGAYGSNDFSEPRLFHLSIQRKTQNSPSWDVWFSLINSNLFIFWLPGLCCKNSYVSWLCPCLSEAVSQSYLRC